MLSIEMIFFFFQNLKAMKFSFIVYVMQPSPGCDAMEP